MISPIAAVASRAALYPIQSIIIIALVVSAAYFHLLDIARNSPVSSSSIASGDMYAPLSQLESQIWSRKYNDDEWKWTLDPIDESDSKVASLF